jgi:hypothetical protein
VHAVPNLLVSTATFTLSEVEASEVEGGESISRSRKATCRRSNDPPTARDSAASN